jgi:chloride channel protein, CIC family
VTTADTDEQLTGRAYLRLILLGALIGIPAALFAAVFLAFVHKVESWLWDDLPNALGASSPPWYLVVFLPVAGAGIVLVARLFLPGDGGHSPLLGIGGGVTPLSHGLGIALAALGTLAFGAVLGPEAPLIALGSVVGVAVTKFVKLGNRETTVLATAGSFSAVSALFGGPLVAGMLLLEASVGLGSMAVPALLPGLVSAAIGYVIFVGLGDWGGLNTTAMSVPGLPPYNGTHVLDLVLAVVLGVITALLLQLVRIVGTRVSQVERRRPMMPWLLLGGGLAVGLIALIADGLGGDSQAVLFSGQAAVPELVNETSASVVVVLLVAKAIAYAISLGCGFRGGPVFPAIFLGVALATLTVVWFDTSPTFAVAVGTAAGMAAMTRLVFASLLFSLLLVGTVGLDTGPAAVLAASAAWVTTYALSRRD